jgi:hypothetical protein
MKGGASMIESIGLGAIIAGAICGVGMIQLIMGIVVAMRHPGYDDLLPDFVPNASSAQPEESGTSRTAAS